MINVEYRREDIRVLPASLGSEKKDIETHKKMLQAVDRTKCWPNLHADDTKWAPLVRQNRRAENWAAWPTHALATVWSQRARKRARA
jgi:U3 small nucleolar RNA-associated protein 14